MPDEIEVPMDAVSEKIAEEHHKRAHAAEGAEHPIEESWMRYVAVGTALLAVVAAVGALQSGLLVNEALLQKNEQVSRLTQASDQWNYYQAEGVKSLIYRTAAQAQPAASPVAKTDAEQSKHYQKKQDEIKAEADRLTKEAQVADRSAERFLSRHHIFAFSVSLCQIAIALSAVAALTKRRYIWQIGSVAGVVGAALLIYGFLR